MPGLSFVCDFKGHLREKESRLLTSLDLLFHFHDYDKQILLNESSYFLACTRYKEYPLISFENENYLIHIEGRIYGKPPALITDELNMMAGWLFESPIRREEDITQWLLNTDGDFILFILEKNSGDIAILNDALGRLPLYYSYVDGELIVSREVRFIANVSDIRTLDRMAVAHYLLLGYPLGRKTLLDQIYRLTPATLIKVDNRQSKAQTRAFTCFNFGVKAHCNRTIEENADELASLFSRACINRTNSANQNVIGLSGGLDSRAVAACLHQNKIPFFAVTRLDFRTDGNLEPKIAEEVAALFNIDWRLFRLGPPKGKDFVRLLKMKNGLNYLAVSPMLPFLDKVRDTFGSNATYWTGDGGNKLQTDFRPACKLNSLPDLVNYIVTRHQVLPLPTVAELTQIPKQKILEDIEAAIFLYPERELTDKYFRFYIDEKTFKWNFEGEDRNKFFFWTMAPFFSMYFFRHLIGCPDEQKAGHALYRAFLAKLSPEASAINNANWGFSLDSKRYALMRFLRGLFLNKLSPTLAKKLLHPGRPACPSQYLDVLQRQVANCTAIGNYLSPRIFESIKNSNQIQVQTLLTITSVIEEMECGKSTLENLSECDFA